MSVYHRETSELMQAVEATWEQPRPAGSPALIAHLDGASTDLRAAARHVATTPSGKTVGALRLGDCEQLLLVRGFEHDGEQWVYFGDDGEVA